MEIIAAATLNGLLLSSLYILVALGLALLLSIMGVFNFAHGAIYMVGGYVCYQFTVEYGLNQWLSLFLSALAIGAFGLFLEKFCFRPFSRDMNRTIVMVMALILILQTTVNVTVGAYTRRIPAFAEGTIGTGIVSVSTEKLITFAISGILLLLIVLFVRKTKAGLQMLAISQDREGAALQGISINRISALACAMGCSLAAIAGSLLGAITSLSPFMGDYMLVKAIQLVILSGIGSIGGLLVAGLIVGFIDATLPLFTGGVVSQSVSLGIIFVLLLLRPQGLFGREVLA